MIKREKIKNLIRRQNQKGKLLWLRTAWHNLRDLWRFYPIKRIFNLLYFAYLIVVRRYSPLKLNDKKNKGVFYLCLEREGNESLLLKIPHLKNRFSYALYKKLRSSQVFNEYSNLLLSLLDDPILGQHFPYVKKVRRDGGYLSSYVKGYNLIQVRDMLRDGQYLPSDLKSSEFILSIDILLERLKKFELQNGQIFGDWALHNLIYDKKAKKIINVDLEGFFIYRHGELESNMEYLLAVLNFLKVTLELRKSRKVEDINILKALSVVGHIIKSDVSYSGDDYPLGYHSFNLRGKYFRGQRECATRIASVPYDFTKKVVLDLGCNCGGMLQCLVDKILMGVGIDLDARYINGANIIKCLNGNHNLHFYTFDFEKDDLSLIDSFILERRVDICFLLSVCMWLKNWKKVIVYASKMADTLLFETNGDELQQRDQVEFLLTCFAKVELINPESADDLRKNNRELYLCQNVQTT